MLEVNLDNEKEQSEFFDSCIVSARCTLFYGMCLMHIAQPSHVSICHQFIVLSLSRSRSHSFWSENRQHKWSEGQERDRECFETAFHFIEWHFVLHFYWIVCTYYICHIGSRNFEWISKLCGMHMLYKLLLLINAVLTLTLYIRWDQGRFCLQFIYIYIVRELRLSLFSGRYCRYCQSLCVVDF